MCEFALFRRTCVDDAVYYVLCMCVYSYVYPLCVNACVLLFFCPFNSVWLYEFYIARGQNKPDPGKLWAVSKKKVWLKCLNQLLIRSQENSEK